MNTYLINGGSTIDGKLCVQNSKNSFLPLLASCLICDEPVVLKKYPNITDLHNMLKILNSINVCTTLQNDDIIVDPTNADDYIIPQELAKTLRSSIFLLGAVLTRFGKCKIPYPGGCNIGARPIDLHIKGLKVLNVDITEDTNWIYCDGTNMHSGTIYLDFPSVGATENLILASVKLKGTTKIYNPAKEPEIVDLQDFLNSIGCKVRGAGSDIITIEGVRKTHGTEFTPISDRIVSGTYMVACAMVGGSLFLENVNPKHNKELLKILKNSGARVDISRDTVFVKSNGKLCSYPFIRTAPYPGFPTDLQSIVMSMQTISKGECVIDETVFENRFKHITELSKMGADICLKYNKAYIYGVDHLDGANVQAYDLRGGAGMTLAGLVAKGQTKVENTQYIDRGYDDFVGNLQSLGMDIKLI